MLKFGNEKHIGVGSGGDADWGYIEGTLSDQTDLNTALNGKQSTLISGTNIKTVNGVSLLGSGDVVIGEGGTIAIDQTYNSESTNAQSGTAVAEGLLTVANKDLSNLSSTGQMIVDSANGTISNCVLEIPQNIKLTLENNVLTLKAGSVITLTGSTYSTVTTTQDYTTTIPSYLNGKKVVIFCAVNGGLSGGYVDITSIQSGSSLPATGSVFFNTTDKLLYSYASGEWTVWNRTYPICIIVVDSEGNVSFAKDSNGNDMIFNGAGFVGHHAFVYPNVKGLIANGFNVDGTLKSTNTTLNSLRIPSLTASRTNATVCLGLNTINAHRVYTIVDDVSEITTGDYNIWYVRNENQMYLVQNSQNNVLNETVLITYSTDSNNNVTDFIIQQPVRMATTEMLDKKQDTLTFDTTPTSASTNPVTSGGVYTALSGKQADITTITGYDATKTQTLKNVSGVLTWVDDGE